MCKGPGVQRALAVKGLAGKTADSYRVLKEGLTDRDPVLIDLTSIKTR